jgi:tetratricopeptide (TPR) repeat protein
MARWLALLVACFVAVAAPRAARADDPAQRAAKRHYDRGEKLFALGKFDEALDEYQKAFDAKPLPGFLFNIGQCYRNLDDYDQAIFSFKKYLKLDPETPKRPAVEKLLEELEEKKERGEGKRLIREPDKDKDRHDTDQETDKGKQEPVRLVVKTPIYKKWWFLAGAGAVAVLGGVGIYEGTRSGAPSTDLGNIVFGK